MVDLLRDLLFDNLISVTLFISVMAAMGYARLVRFLERL